MFGTQIRIWILVSPLRPNILMHLSWHSMSLSIPPIEVRKTCDLGVSIGQRWVPSSCVLFFSTILSSYIPKNTPLKRLARLHGRQIPWILENPMFRTQIRIQILVLANRLSILLHPSWHCMSLTSYKKNIHVIMVYRISRGPNVLL